jgi:Uma2 family endonuclease
MGMVAKHITPITPQEYLEMERRSTIKHEYLNGQVYAMSGASYEHTQIASNVARLLGNQLENRECDVVLNDLRVRVSPTGLYTYPDVVVICGEPRFSDSQMDTLLNPVLIVEVLSPTTEAYDRGDKFSHYRTLESLTDYILLSQNRQRIEHYYKQADGEWRFRAAETEGSSITVTSLGVTLDLATIYRRVNTPLFSFTQLPEQEEPPVNGERPT